MTIGMFVAVGVAGVVLVLVGLELLGALLGWIADRRFEAMSPEERRVFSYQAYRDKLAADAEPVE